uniref:Fam-e protein n=1 Tax=Strongyloides papillosus TaxID=174720 RepID=A0A0N5CF02_STREA
MYLTKLFFNVVSCYANAVNVDYGVKYNSSLGEFFDVACGLDEKLINNTYNFNNVFKCQSPSNFLNLEEKMPVECRLTDGINYHCTYNHFEHKEGCKSLPELCEIAYLRCLNHTTINVPVEIKTTQPATTKKLINDLKYRAEMEQSNFSQRTNNVIRQTTIPPETTTNYPETLPSTTKIIVISTTEPNYLETTDNYSASSLIFVYTNLEDEYHNEFIYDLTFFVMSLITIIICFLYVKRRFTKKGNAYELVDIPSSRSYNSISLIITFKFQ